VAMLIRTIAILNTFYFVFIDKIEVSVDGAILGNQVPLLVILRRPIYFNYEIEFIDINGVLDTVEVEKGKTSFSYNLKVCIGTRVL